MTHVVPYKILRIHEINLKLHNIRTCKETVTMRKGIDDTSLLTHLWQVIYLWGNWKWHVHADCICDWEGDYRLRESLCIWFSGLDDFYLMYVSSPPNLSLFFFSFSYQYILWGNSVTSQNALDIHSNLFTISQSILFLNMLFIELHLLKYLFIEQC